MRRAGFVLALAASWAVLVLWAAGVDPRAPLAPAEQRELHGDAFAPIFGRASAADGRLRVEAPGEDFTSLQSLGLAGIDASEFPTLRYRFSGFPRTLELTLVFRTAEDPSDVHTVSVPWPGRATGTFDLGRIPEWQGHIVEIGFAQYPLAQIVPPGKGFRPFEIADAALWSRSWEGDLSALATDWFGAWPWTQRSVHALGRDTDTPRARPIVLAAALGVALVPIWYVPIFGWRDRRAVKVAVIAAAIGWVGLDFVWQAGLWARMQTTRAIYADLSWEERERTLADAEIAAAAKTLKTLLAEEAPEARVLVHAGSGYELLRFIWHALPLNISDYLHAAIAGEALPEGCYIVFFDSDDWRTKPAFRRLLAYSERVLAPDSIQRDAFENERLVVFRFRHGR